jgi:hypothetical protein
MTGNEFAWFSTSLRPGFEIISMHRMISRKATYPTINTNVCMAYIEYISMDVINSYTAVILQHRKKTGNRRCNDSQNHFTTSLSSPILL